MNQPPRSVVGSPSRLAGTGVVSLILVAVLAACGASSKPAYCNDIANFKNSAQELTHVSSASGLVTQAQKVASSGQTALAAVQTAFVPQTSAVKTSLATLKNSAQQLSNSTTRAAALVAIPAQAQAVVTAAGNLESAAKSGKCS
jgi:hypothetical protein